MKTPLELAIDFIYDEIMFDKVNGLPKNDGLYSALKTCKNLLEEEKAQIKLAYDTGNVDYASYDQYARNSEDYYRTKYDKK